MWTHLALFLVLAPGQAGRPAPTLLEAPDRPVALVSKSLGGRPAVDLSINGRGPYTFIVDTGASGSVIDASLARELGLPVIGRARVGSPVGSQVTDVDQVAMERLTLGAVVVGGVVAVAMDFPHGLASRGVLSPAALPGLLLTIDYPRQEIRLERGHLPAADGSEVFEYPATARLPTIPVHAGDVTANLHVDSGSPGFITFSSRYKDRLPLASAPTPAGRARTAGGEVEILEAPLAADVRIGSRTFAKPTIQLIDTSAEGNVGARFLRDYVLTVDHDHRRIRLVAQTPAPPREAPVR
jgi:hypothetical protein